MIYLLDANTFIQAKNHHYRFSVFPCFWDWLLQANQAGTVFSIVKVQDELKSGSDQLATWAVQQGAGLFLPPDPLVTAALTVVSNWVQQRAYEPQALAQFLGAADYWLVAHALANGWSVVTHEVPAPGSRKRVKIPDVCAGLGVGSTNPFQMLEDEGARFT